MTLNELLTELEQARARLEAAIAGLEEAALRQAMGGPEAWSVCDVLSHCTAWEAELVTGLARTARGGKPVQIAYSEEDLQAFNHRVAEETGGRPAARVLADFRGVRKQTVRQLQALAPGELNRPRPWLKTEQIKTGTVAEWAAYWLAEHETAHAAEIAAWRAGR